MGVAYVLIKGALVFLWVRRVLVLLIGLGIYVCCYDALVSNVKNSGNDE
jgi:hypothetical protein